jgi:hypothetical protein
MFYAVDEARNIPVRHETAAQSFVFSPDGTRITEAKEVILLGE